MINVVILNGGRGASTIIPCLLNENGIKLTALVNAYDDGKSTGMIRRFFNMLGPSDIRKVQELMLPNTLSFDDNMKLFTYRYPQKCSYDEVLNELESFVRGTNNSLVGIKIKNQENVHMIKLFMSKFLSWIKYREKIENERFNFADCSIMNCIYAGAFIFFNRDLEEATHSINKMFKLKGDVLPTSLELRHLVAQRQNGDVLSSEAEIVEMRSNVVIDKIYLLDSPLKKDFVDKFSSSQVKEVLEMMHSPVSVSKSVAHALTVADIIIYAPGTQHSSLYPTYLTQGVANLIGNNRKALKIFITNIGTDYETPTYKASDYIKSAYKYLCSAEGYNYNISSLFDFAFVNKLTEDSIDREYVELDESELQKLGIQLILENWESRSKDGKHDGKIVVEKIMNLYEKRTANSNYE